MHSSSLCPLAFHVFCLLFVTRRSGYYCGAGAVAPTACPAGTYCSAWSAAPTPCAPGRYSDPGSVFCTLCPAGQSTVISSFLHGTAPLFRVDRLAVGDNRFLSLGPRFDLVTSHGSDSASCVFVTGTFS